jgi:hypothetical protein
MLPVDARLRKALAALANGLEEAAPGRNGDVQARYPARHRQSREGIAAAPYAFAKTRLHAAHHENQRPPKDQRP